MSHTLHTIIRDCNIPVTHHEPVHGGDINHAYCLYTTATKYFLKVNAAGRYPSLFEKEADGLEALRQHSTLTIPQVIQHGIAGPQQYLLLEWLSPASPQPGSAEAFGRALAQLHRVPQAYFGWQQDNYIGSLVQTNTPHSDWAAFYTNCRIMPLVRILYDNRFFSKRDLATAESLCHKLAALLPGEPPALLHGDLWSGNYMFIAGGKAAIFDPAVYSGHREMDIGMTKLFGGFDLSFYKGYQEVYPLVKGWEDRLSLTQLYPLLVHAVLFGGHYVSNASDILKLYA